MTPKATSVQNEALQVYDKHYGRMGNVPPDWATAGQADTRYISAKPWLPASKNAQILDFGCGWGHQLVSLWQVGYRHLEGVDISRPQAVVAECALLNKASIYCMDGREFIKSKPCTYDLITLNDVIEHVSPNEALTLLEALRAALKEGGRLVLRTPNMSSLLAAYSLHLDVTHVAGYTEWSLMQLLDVAGFVDHRLVEAATGWEPRSWRPWLPLRGLGLRSALNRTIHRALYAIRCQYPVPKCFDYNVELYSHKPQSSASATQQN